MITKIRFMMANLLLPKTHYIRKMPKKGLASGNDFVDLRVHKTNAVNAQLKIWQQPSPHEVYALGADPAYGYNHLQPVRLSDETSSIGTVRPCLTWMAAMNDIENYESRRIGRDTAESGIVVSTAYTSDEGYETALLDKNGAHPVERYESKTEAEAGHKKWIAFANTANGKTVKKLGGWGGIVEDEDIVLCV